MAEPVKNIQFGGVTLNENEISKKSMAAKKNEMSKKDASEKDSIFSVEFKNGVKISYPYQEGIKDDTNIILNPSIKTSVDGVPFLEYARTSVSGLSEAKIFGAEDKTDYIYLGNSRNCFIDVGNDAKYDEVCIETTKGSKKAATGNEVRLGENTFWNDKATIKGREIKGPGIAAEDSY